MRVSRWWPLLGLLTVTTAWAHDDGDEKLQSQINTLQQQMQSVQRVIQSEALLDMLKQIEDLQTEVQQLRNSNEVLVHELDNMKSRQRELYLDIDRRLQDLEAGGVTAAAVDTNQPQTAVVTAPAANVAAQPPTQSGVAQSETSVAEQREAYKSAFQLLHGGQYAQAITAFQAFLQSYPGSGYAPNAQYWLGEAYYATKDYDQAVAAFQTVGAQYPDSAKAQDAGLKLGYTYYEQANWDKAREQLNRVMADYPNSSPARLAEKRLDRMTQEGH